MEAMETNGQFFDATHGCGLSVLALFGRLAVIARCFEPGNASRSRQGIRDFANNRNTFESGLPRWFWIWLRNLLQKFRDLNV